MSPGKRQFLSTGFSSFFSGLTYVDGTSFLHSLHPLVKLTALIFYSLAVFTAPSLKSGIVLFLILMLSYRAGSLGWGFFSRKLRFILIFALFILLVQIIWVREGYLILRLDLGIISPAIWSEGLWGGLIIMLRFINVIGSSYLFVATTDPNKLGYAFIQAGLPYRIGFMFITALRFIPVFYHDLAQVKNAQMAKGIDLQEISPKGLLKAIKYLMVPLVISALSRIDTLTISMESRAFGLHGKRSYLVTQSLSRKDKLVMASFPLIFVLFFLTLC